MTPLTHARIYFTFGFLLFLESFYLIIYFASINNQVESWLFTITNILCSASMADALVEIKKIKGGK